MTPETQLTVITQEAAVNPLPALPLEQVREYIKASKSTSTLRGYSHDWKTFCAWCDLHGVTSLPASSEVVASYLAGCADSLKTSTLQRILSAITAAHGAKGLEPPAHHGLVANCLKGIRRLKGTAPNQKAPTLTDDIRSMIAVTSDGLSGQRDRALVLLGFAGAFRRSELVALEVRDLEFGRDGLVILLRKSKTDQTGEGRKVGICYGSNPDLCPVRNLQSWLEAAAITEGPVFRSVNRHGQVKPDGLSAQSVALLIKKLAERCCLDATKYAGHSLRAGHCTSAAIAGASERSIMAQTGHRSVQMLRKYIRDGSLFRENSASKLGL